MGVRLASVQSDVFVGPLPANANETVVLVTPPINLTLDFATIYLLWMGNIATGASTTALTFTLRRGTTAAGVIVGVNTPKSPATAGQNLTMSGWYFDAPGAVAGQQYALTVQQNGATAAGVWNGGALAAFVL